MNYYLKGVIRFRRFVKKIQSPMENGRKGSIFSMFSKIGLWVSLKILIFKPLGLSDLVGDLNLFS